MDLLFIALALVVLPPTARSDFPPCPNMTPECKIKMLELKTLLTYFNTSYLPPLSDMHNLKEELCQETNRCLSSCSYALSKYKEICEELRTHIYDVDTKCIRYALRVLLIHKNFTFFTIDPSLKRKAYADGKDLFIGCSRCPELKKDYDNIMDLYTIPPVVREKCNTPYDKFQKIQCEALLDYFKEKFGEMNGRRFNATELSEYSGMCQDCIDSTCLMQPQKSEKWKIFYSGKKHAYV